MPPVNKFGGMIHKDKLPGKNEGVLSAHIPTFEISGENADLLRKAYTEGE